MERAKFFVVQYTFNGKKYLEAVPKKWVRSIGDETKLIYPKSNVLHIMDNDRKDENSDPIFDHVLYDCVIKRYITTTIKDADDLVRTMCGEYQSVQNFL